MPQTCRDGDFRYTVGKRLACERGVMCMINVPTWFKGRQGKVEAIADGLYRLTGPNLPETFLGVRRADNGKLQGYFRYKADGPDDAVTDPKFDSEYDAWDVAFEMYREKIII
jgi:hypothetical protein